MGEDCRLGQPVQLWMSWWGLHACVLAVQPACIPAKQSHWCMCSGLVTPHVVDTLSLCSLLPQPIVVHTCLYVKNSPIDGGALNATGSLHTARVC